MNTPDWHQWRCRCSAISKILTNSRENAPLTDLQEIRLRELEKKADCDEITPKQRLELTSLIQKKEISKEVKLGDTAISYLLEEYAWLTAKKCSITKELEIEQIQKGRLGEKEGRELLSYVDNYYYEKNEERLYNEFLSGEPDTWEGESVHNATGLPDIKIIWDYPGFLKKIVKPMEPEYAAQLGGYGILSGAKKLFRASCCITTPPEIRNSIKMRLFYKRAYLTEEDPEFLKEWAILEQSMIMEGIPHHQRVHKAYADPFTDKEVVSLYDRVKIGRDYLSSFHELYLKLNK